MRTRHWLAVGVCVALLALAAVLYIGASGGPAAAPENADPKAPTRALHDPLRGPNDPSGAQPTGELAATESPSADNGEAPATPADAPPAAAQPTGEDAPAEAPRDFLAASQAPLLRWDLTSADYKRIFESPDSTDEERLEARARHLSGFADWPGRDVPRLGGFAFKPGDYRLLDGLEMHDPLGVRVHMLGQPPLVYLERKVSLFNPRRCVWIYIRMFTSRELAQRELLYQDLLPLISSRGYQPMRPGTEVGDSCVVSWERDGGATKIGFVRHNVYVELFLTRDRESFAGSMLPLAAEIDAAVQAQSHRARTWEDLAAHRPRIEAFRPLTPEIRPVSGPWTGRGDEVDTRHESALDVRVSGENAKLYCQPEEAAYRGGILRVNIADAPTKVGASEVSSTRTQATTYDLWLVAYYGDSLLFSAAAAAITVHPPKPPQ